MTSAYEEKVIHAPELLDLAQSIDDSGKGSEDIQSKRRRIFVKELAGKYSEVYKSIFEVPRVIHPDASSYNRGPQHYTSTPITPEDFSATQLFHCGTHILAPGAKSGNHGHMNSAVFYILEGRGYDIHDGVKIPYEAGDVAIVEPGCVHQHFNADPDKVCRMLMVKAKPIYLFANLGFQRSIEGNPKEAVPGWEGWLPDEVIAQGGPGAGRGDS